jgi:hypothetical protein
MKYGVWNRDYDLHKNGVDHLVAKRRLIHPRRQETHTQKKQPSTRRALQIDSRLSKVIRSGGPIRCGRSHRSVCTSPKTRCTSAACCGRSGVVVASRHRLKSRPRGHECAASVSTVAYTSALSTVQTYGVRRAGAREKVCCLPTRMVSSVLNHEVP